MRKTNFLSLLVLLTLAITSNAMAVSRHSRVRYRQARRRVRAHHRHIVWNPIVRGSHESLVRQNAEIDRLGLPRIEDDDQLQLLEDRKELVEIPESRSLRIAENLEPTHRYCKPWTLGFLQDLSEAYYQRFHQPIQVNSAVRTMEQQRQLRRHNPNAAPIEGDTASSHLAGTTVDLAKRGMTRAQRRWMGEYLKSLSDQGLIEAAEERRQACFHIMVAERYSGMHDDQRDTDTMDKTAAASGMPD